MLTKPNKDSKIAITNLKTSDACKSLLFWFEPEIMLFKLSNVCVVIEL